jgi:ABC-type Mn2+/Zn2+ transport system permease subunit
LLAITGRDLVFAAIASTLAIAGSLTLGHHWLAVGFDASSAPRSRAADLALLALAALVSIAALAAVGALLATALLVVPAATTRLWTRRIVSWQLATVALTAAEGAVGIWLSVRTNAPPGATIATLAGAAFVVSALWKGRQ